MKKMSYLLFGFLVMNQSCQSKRVENSNLSHSIQQIQQGDLEEYYDLSKEQLLAMYPNEKLYDRSNPMVSFLDRKAKEIHDQLKKQNPNITVVPPDIYALDVDDLNAMAIPTNVCIPINLLFGDASATDSSRHLMLDSEKSVEMIDSPEEAGAKCNTVLQLSEEQVIEKLKKVNLDINKCFKKIGHQFIYQKGCKEHLDQLNGRSHQVIYGAASNVLLFYTKILKEMKEKDVVSILTHEMAHYYRQHSHQYQGQYNFFYKLDQHRNPKDTPIPTVDMELNQLGAEVRNIGRNELIGYYKAPHLWLSPIAFHLFVGGLGGKNIELYEKMCVDGTVSKNCAVSACDELLKKIDGERLLYFPFYESWPNSKLELYRTIENLSESCFSKIPVNTAANKELIQNSLDSGFVKIDFISHSEWSIQSNLFEVAKRTGTLASYKIAEVNKRNMKLVETANRKRLGFYTSEQNADEVGTEIALLAGLKIDDIYESILAMMKIEGETRGFKNYPPYLTGLPGELNYNSCKKALKDQFQKFVPIADYVGLHHAQCFRVYNVFREYNVHKDYYDQIDLATNDYIANDAKWVDLQKSLD